MLASLLNQTKTNFMSKSHHGIPHHGAGHAGPDPLKYSISPERLHESSTRKWANYSQLPLKRNRPERWDFVVMYDRRLCVNAPNFEQATVISYRPLGSIWPPAAVAARHSVVCGSFGDDMMATFMGLDLSFPALNETIADSARWDVVFVWDEDWLVWFEGFEITVGVWCLSQFYKLNNLF